MELLTHIKVSGILFNCHNAISTAINPPYEKADFQRISFIRARTTITITIVNRVKLIPKLPKL